MQPDRPLGRFLPNPKLKLREQLAEVCRYRHMSHRSENAYWHWIKGFIQFHRGKNSGNARPHPGPLPQGEGGDWRHPRDLGTAEVREYLSHLASEKNVAKATQLQAFSLVEGLRLRVEGQAETNEWRRPLNMRLCFSAAW